MCCIEVLIYLLQMFFIQPFRRLGNAIRWAIKNRPMAVLFLGYCYIFFVILCLMNNAMIPLNIVNLMGFILIIIPIVIIACDCFMTESRTHPIESQDMHAGFRNVDPDPEAPLLPVAQQRSVISIPDPRAIWSTEPLRQQPVFDDSDIRRNIYRQISPTHRPPARKRVPEHSMKRDSSSKESPRHQRDYIDTSFTHRRTRADTRRDIQQQGSASGSPSVALNIPDIEVDPPTDTSENSDPVEESEYRNPHSASAYGTSTVISRREARYDKSFLTPGSYYDATVKRHSGKDNKETKFARIKKRLNIQDDSSTSKTVRETQKTSSKHDETIRYGTFSPEEGSSFKSFRSGIESFSQTNIAEHPALDIDERSSSRASDSGTTVTTWSERSESSGSSRHSSPGDGKRTPKFEDSPKVHISRKSRKDS